MNYSHLSTNKKSLKSSRALITPSKNCSEIIFAAPNTFLPPVIIYSYPGSGNTWLRHLLQVTTGYWTGSLTLDKRLQNRSSGAFRMVGEGNPVNSGETVAVKSHNLRGITEKLGAVPEKCIVLIRNPADAFMSDLSMQLTRSHTAKVDFSRYFDIHKTQMPKFREKLSKEMPSAFIETFTSLLKTAACHQNLTLFYEDLKINVEHELARVLEFLGFSGERLVCLERNSTGSFKRNQPTSNREWLSKLWNEREKENLTRLLEDFPLQLPENYSFF